MDREVTALGETYRIIRLLGHGKGGYSYLAEKDNRQFVLKQIHHFTNFNPNHISKNEHESRRNAGTMSAWNRRGSGSRK